MKKLFTFILCVSSFVFVEAQTCPTSVTSNNSTRILFNYANDTDKANTYSSFNGGALQGVVTITGIIGGVTFTPDATDNNADVDDAEFSKGELLEAGTNVFFRTGNVTGVTAGSLTGTVDLKFGSTEISCTYNAGVLPVMYARFSATNKGETALLSWTTGSEINNDYFSIERSTNGKDFTAIGKVTGAGNSEDFVDYSFTDKIPFNGVNYYRLRQVDFDGAENLSEIQTVKMDNRQTSAIAVYPTLSEGEVIVDLTIVSGDALETQIVTSTGAIVRSLTLNGGTKATINTSDLASGFYFINVKTAQSISVGKFMVR